jgi:hypothetical protein
MLDALPFPEIWLVDFEFGPSREKIPSLCA